MLSIREDKLSIYSLITSNRTCSRQSILYVSETEAEDLQRFEINTSTEEQNFKDYKSDGHSSEVIGINISWKAG